MVGQSYTDDEGRFYFNGLPGNIYHLEINEDGFMPVNETIVSDPDTAPTRMVNIYLVPREQRQTGETTVAGENPYLTNEAEYGKLYPTAAVKEFKAGEKADRKRKADEAISLLREGDSIAPTFYMARNNLGTLYLGKAQYACCGGTVRKSNRHLNPNDASAYFNLGNLYLLKKRDNDALSWSNRG